MGGGGGGGVEKKRERGGGKRGGREREIWAGALVGDKKSNIHIYLSDGIHTGGDLPVFIPGLLTSEPWWLVHNTF